nr:hypothetical protein [Tanacetum cinerariifolium]
MKIYTTLQKKVLDLEDELKRTKTAQQTKIDSLERRVKKLEKEDTSKQGRIDEIDADEDIALASKRKGVIIQVPEETTTKTASSQQPQLKRYKLKLMKRIGYQERERERERERAQKEQKANDALINTWDDIQAKFDADAQLAQRLHEEEQLQFTDAEKAILFIEFMEKRRKFLLSKREGDELEQERSKKQKIEDDKESAELKQCLKIIPDDGNDVTIDATPLSFKSLTTVDYKIYKEGKKNYF